MSGNRVEKLEERVKELEASIEGLTDELVECKVRLRELEGAVDEDLGFAPESTQESNPDTAAESADRTNTEAGDEEGEETESDIIVA